MPEVDNDQYAQACTGGDISRAAIYSNGESGMYRELGAAPGASMFWFERSDGAIDWYTADDLRGATWWQLLPERIALSISAALSRTATLPTS